VNLWLDHMCTPLGTILLVSDDCALRALDFADYEPRMHQLLRRYCGSYTLRPTKDPGRFSRRIEAYFAGDLLALDQIPVRTTGTFFQCQVWATLRQIQIGTTTTYAHLAARIGRPTATRAVGRANGANPIAIVVPCHRVIGADGRPTGYAGGIARKEWLLRHEARAT
jgi:methylated-DNA-[protein]-cysteine S-methyltransferase